jgi:arsenite methyltransferase
MSVDDAALYPLFTDELLHLMRTLIPREQQDELAVAVVVTARLAAAGDRRGHG